MFANSPHASASTPPLSPLPAHAAPAAHAQVVQQQPGIQHGHHPGMPPAGVNGGLHGMHTGPAAPAQPLAARPAVAHRHVASSFVTGAYQSSGDPAIDRMVRLEAACKRFGSPI